jgi:membrane protein implicated in regulation of membrane protease activity
MKSILAFFMVFGWSGLAAVSSGKLAVGFVIFISFLAGIAMMLVTAWLLFLLSKLEQSGNLDVKNAIGENGEVYLPIPGNKKGVGKIQIIVQNQLQTLDAVTLENEDIKSGTKITVINVEPDRTLLVIRKKEY